jgi:hypothetical protein
VHSATGLVELANILGEAIAEFPDYQVPARPEIAEEAYAQLSKSALERLEQLDRRAWQALSEVHSRLLDYLREHRADVLVPETPLSRRIGRLVQ